MREKLVAMLTMQDEMNTKVHPEWKKQGFEWYRAIWTECAELMDHYGWKWWKKQDPDFEQVKLELIDIWHFGMSILLLSGKSVDALTDAMVTDLDSPKAEGGFREAVEGFACDTLSTKTFNVARFASVMKAAGMSCDDLYLGYVGKNVLNFFRQDHGYKEGSYIKQWNGREDNEHLVDIIQTLNPNCDDFKDQLYAGLKTKYIEINA